MVFMHGWRHLKAIRSGPGMANWFESLGLKPNPIREFMRDGALLAKFFFVQDPDGYKIEVIQRHGRYR